ncbi:hypothetical protein [Cellulomonas sp. URHB0016]
MAGAEELAPAVVEVVGPAVVAPGVVGPEAVERVVIALVAVALVGVAPVVVVRETTGTVGETPVAGRATGADGRGIAVGVPDPGRGVPLDADPAGPPGSDVPDGERPPEEVPEGDVPDSGAPRPSRRCTVAGLLGAPAA